MCDYHVHIGSINTQPKGLWELKPGTISPVQASLPTSSPQRFVKETLERNSMLASGVSNYMPHVSRGFLIQNIF